jgi:hypothetical protein
MSKNNELKISINSSSSPIQPLSTQDLVDAMAKMHYPWAEDVASSNALLQALVNKQV